MNERIQHIIQDIRNKKDALKDLLGQQMQKANQLEGEIERLKSELETSNSRISQLTNDNVELKTLLEEAKNQIVESAASGNNSHEQIDELVREIEYCIGQLKNNA